MNGQPDVRITEKPAAVGGHITWVRWRIVVLLMGFSYVSWFLRVSMSVAYDERIKDTLGIDPKAMGWVYSSLLIVYALCMTPGGWFIDKYGTRSALVLMGFGLTLFEALTGLVGGSPKLLGELPARITLGFWTLATPVYLFLVIRGMMGIFAAPMYPASAQTIAHWLPFRRRGIANGLVQGSALLGIASTPLFLGELIDWFDWPQALLVVSVCTGLLTILFAYYATDRPEQHPHTNQAERLLIEKDQEPVPREMHGPARGSWVQLLENRSLVCLTFSYAAVGYFEYLFFFWMDYYFKDELHLPDDVRRVYAGIPFLAMALGMAAGGWICDWLVVFFGYRRGRAILPVGGMLVGAAFLLVGVMVRLPELIVASFSVALAAVGATEAPFWTTAQELGGRRGATAAGICNTGGNAGGLIAPIVTPMIGERFGWPVAIAAASGVCLFGVVLWFWIDPRERVEDSGQ